MRLNQLHALVLCLYVSVCVWGGGVYHAVSLGLGTLFLDGDGLLFGGCWLLVRLVVPSLEGRKEWRKKEGGVPRAAIAIGLFCRLSFVYMYIPSCEEQYVSTGTEPSSLLFSSFLFFSFLAEHPTDRVILYDERSSTRDHALLEEAPLPKEHCAGCVRACVKQKT